MPAKIKKKISPKTVNRRLAEKGYFAQKKIQKNDPGPKLCKTRLKFVSQYEGKPPSWWNQKLQGVADIKDFTYYPRKLKVC